MKLFLNLIFLIFAHIAYSQSLFEGLGEREDWLGTYYKGCLLYTSPSPRDVEESRMPSSA